MDEIKLDRIAREAFKPVKRFLGAWLARGGIPLMDDAKINSMIHDAMRRVGEEEPSISAEAKVMHKLKEIGTKMMFEIMDTIERAESEAREIIIRRTK